MSNIVIKLDKKLKQYIASQGYDRRFLFNHFFNFFFRKFCSVGVASNITIAVIKRKNNNAKNPYKRYTTSK